MTPEKITAIIKNDWLDRLLDIDCVASAYVLRQDTVDAGGRKGQPIHTWHIDVLTKLLLEHPHVTNSFAVHSAELKNDGVEVVVDSRIEKCVQEIIGLIAKSESPTKTPTAPGQAAYETHCRRASREEFGPTLPPWTLLMDSLKSHWEDVAQAAINAWKDKCRTEMRTYNPRRVADELDISAEKPWSIKYDKCVTPIKDIQFGFAEAGKVPGQLVRPKGATTPCKACGQRLAGLFFAPPTCKECADRQQVEWNNQSIADSEDLYGRIGRVVATVLSPTMKLELVFQPPGQLLTTAWVITRDGEKCYVGLDHRQLTTCRDVDELIRSSTEEAIRGKWLPDPLLTENQKSLSRAIFDAWLGPIEGRDALLARMETNIQHSREQRAELERLLPTHVVAVSDSQKAP